MKSIGIKTLLMVLAGLVMASAAKADTVKIWALGDSITRGKETPGGVEYPSYRSPLYTTLTDAGWDIDFVGTRGGCADDNDGFNENFPAFLDQDHDGWGSHTTGDILNGKTGGFAGVSSAAPSLNPDMVLIHLGTNDVIQTGYSAADSVDNIEGIIAAVRNVNANAEFYIAQVIPFPAEAANIAALNAEIALEMPKLDTAASPVTVVDMHTGFDTNWLWDGVHPDNNGDQFIARQWYGAIPEPGTLGLLGLGGLGVLLRRKR